MLVRRLPRPAKPGAYQRAGEKIRASRPPAAGENPVNQHERARRQFIHGLRAVVLFYQANPDAFYDGMAVSLSMYAGGRAACEILSAMKLVFGECEQSCGQDHTIIAKKFSDNVKVEFFARAPKSAAVVLPLLG